MQHFALFPGNSANIKMRPPPVVTGISPAEGPPGTKVIIRGEHLGVNAKDVTGMKSTSSIRVSFYVFVYVCYVP